ncbi:MAG TPA: DNA primase [Candidatus Anammoximicrobium sp.]|nr:DNA primase [Candidatus Anammoximicrobium sp.]
MTETAPYGFRVSGSPFDERRLVDWHRAFAAYAACDELADVERESFLSCFTFGADFRKHLESTGTTKGFAGACGSPWLWVDIDRPDLDAATVAARRLAAVIADRYRLDGSELLAFFSGGKGYHLGLPLSLAGSPAPSAEFNAVARRLAEGLAELAGVAIDAGVYDRVRLFRAPNSRHGKTGLHKRRLDFRELLHLGPGTIRDLAEQPEPFDIPAPPAPNSQAVSDWQASAADVERAAAARRERQAGTGNGAGRLNRSTLAAIRGELPTGDRHRLLFSAAANLAELACPPGLAHELLTEGALDAGLAPGEVRRQIDCGLAAGGSLPPAGDQAETSTAAGTPPAGSLPTDAPAATPGGSPISTGTGTAAAPDLQAALARLWQQTAKGIEPCT